MTWLESAADFTEMSLGFCFVLAHSCWWELPDKPDVACLDSPRVTPTRRVALPPLKKLELSEAMGKELSWVVSRMHSTKRVAVPDMKAGTSEADLLAEKASNSRKLLPSQNGGSEHYGEGAGKSRYVWVGATNAKQPPMMPRNKSTDGTKTGVRRLSGTSGGSLVNGYVLTRGIEEAE